MDKYTITSVIVQHIWLVLGVVVVILIMPQRVVVKGIGLQRHVIYESALLCFEWTSDGWLLQVGAVVQLQRVISVLLTGLLHDSRNTLRVILRAALEQL